MPNPLTCRKFRVRGVFLHSDFDFVPSHEDDVGPDQRHIPQNMVTKEEEDEEHHDPSKNDIALLKLSQ